MFAVHRSSIWCAASYHGMAWHGMDAWLYLARHMHTLTHTHTRRNATKTKDWKLHSTELKTWIATGRASGATVQRVSNDKGCDYYDCGLNVESKWRAAGSLPAPYNLTIEIKANQSDNEFFRQRMENTYSMDVSTRTGKRERSSVNKGHIYKSERLS